MMAINMQNSPEQESRAAPALLRCPSCHVGDLENTDGQSLTCGSCRSAYAKIGDSGVHSLFVAQTDTPIKADIQAWWGDLYRQLYAEHETAYTAATLQGALSELEDMFRQRQHLAAMDMPLHELTGKKILEIGSGGGGHSALFKFHGADVTAVDITAERAVGTSLKLQLVPQGAGRAYQADAENLPFRDDVFDIVYSNGVLHHSEDTDQCIAEVHRVLKPGGLAVIMLYSRHSATYWLNIVPRAIVTGEMFRWPEPQWIGRLTEGRPKFGDTVNPVTRVYSAREMRAAFGRFHIVSLRKNSFQFDNFCIPRLTQIRFFVMKAFGVKPHRGGTLVYGEPKMIETSTERWLGTAIGFAWNLVARK